MFETSFLAYSTGLPILKTQINTSITERKGKNNFSLKYLGIHFLTLTLHHIRQFCDLVVKVLSLYI